MTTVPLPWSEHFDTSRQCRGNESPCAFCGRPVKKPRYWVHVVNGGGDLLKIGDTWDEQASDLGLQPIGANCAKQHPELSDYIYKD